MAQGAGTRFLLFPGESATMGARQRSGEGVVRKTVVQKGVFGECVPSLLP